MQHAACPRNGAGLQASARPARGDPVSFVVHPLILTMKNTRSLRETLNKSTFCGEPAQLCDAGPRQIKDVASLSNPKKCPVLFNQRFLRYCGSDRSEKPNHLAVLIDIDFFGTRYFRQTRHRHDVTANHHNELRTRCQSYFSDIDHMPAGCATQRGIRAE